MSATPPEHLRIAERWKQKRETEEKGWKMMYREKEKHTEAREKESYRDYRRTAKLQLLPDSELDGWDLGRGGADARGETSAEKGEGEEGRAIDLTIWGLNIWERPSREKKWWWDIISKKTRKRHFLKKIWKEHQWWISINRPETVTSSAVGTSGGRRWCETGAEW